MDLRVYHGDKVKATDDGKVGGYLVRYSDPATPDLYGDFFTSKTFFGDAIRETKRLDAFYDHGFDGLTKRIPIGTMTLKFDDIGVWAETQIRIAEEHFDEYGGEKRAKAIESAIKSIATKGKLGYSSGAVGHLVDFERVGDSNWIKSWVLGEGSLTPRPAEPKNKVQSLKAFQETPAAVDLASIVKSVGDGTQEIHIHYHQTTEQSTMSEENKQTPEKEEATKVAPPASGDSIPSPTDVDALVDAKVKAALEARDERERQAKAAKEAEEKRINDEVEARLAKMATSRSSTFSPVALRTQGITKDDFTGRFVNYLRAGKNAYLLSKATQELMEMPGVYEGETVKSSSGHTYQADFQLSFSDVDQARIAAGVPRIGSDEYKAIRASRAVPDHLSVKASNATDMNIGTAADGGATVPTGFYNQIITRRDEVALHDRLGCTRIPGQGTTVTVPLDNEADGEFVETNEAAQFDEDAPAVTNLSMTLVAYTKRTLISYQLLDDTGVNIMDYINKRVSIGWGKTINNLLVAEAETGTNYVRGGTTTGFTFGELEDVVFNSDLSPYLSDGGDIAWVGRSPTYGKIIQITGNDRQYGEPMNGPVQGGIGNTRGLLGYPFYFTNKADAIGARGKSLLFGAWSYMLYRDSPSLQFLLDPYTRADYGQNRLLWFMRWDFELSQAAAVGYFEHDLT